MRRSDHGLDTPRDEHWGERALCYTHPEPDLWYPNAGETVGESGAELRAYAAPRAVCAGCPVWKECRAYALERQEPHGMWGGLSPRQRRAMTKAVA